MHKLMQASVFAAIGVLVFASLLIPIVDDATTTNSTFTNDGYYRMASIAATDTTTYIVEWDATAPNVMTVNNEPVELNLDNAPEEVSVIFDNDWGCRANITDGEITSITYIPNNGIGGTASSTMVCTLSEGSMSVVIDSTTTKTEDYTIVYIPDTNGDYIMKNSTSTAYINKDSELIGFGLSNIRYAPSGAGQRGITFNGSLEDDVTPVIWRPPSDTTTTVGDVVINAPSVNGYLDLYALTNITMVATHTNEDATAQTDLTYSYFLVPYQVVSGKAIHADEPTRDILAVLPLILICALIMGVVGYAVYSRIE